MGLDFVINVLRIIRHKYILHYASFGENVIIDANVKTYSPEDISIGNHVRLQDNVWLNAVQHGTDAVLTIEDECDIGRNCFITAKQKVIIERFVILAPNVFISDHSHSFNNLKIAIKYEDTTVPKPVIIGSGSWIGINCVILPGVRIGTHCVIGANSVVNKSIPDFCVAVGSPARVVKRMKQVKK